MSEKIIGYLLLVIGIFVIAFAGTNVYFVFTKKSEPVNLFNFSGVSLDFSNIAPDLPSQKKPDLKQEVVSPDLLNQTSNLAAHIFLMGFIASVGFKIASIGTMLIRPIIVNLKEKSVSTTPVAEK